MFLNSVDSSTKFVHDGLTDNNSASIGWGNDFQIYADICVVRPRWVKGKREFTTKIKATLHQAITARAYASGKADIEQYSVDSYAIQAWSSFITVCDEYIYIYIFRGGGGGGGSVDYNVSGWSCGYSWISVFTLQAEMKNDMCDDMSLWLPWSFFMCVYQTPLETPFVFHLDKYHYSDVIMGTIASQITSVSIVYLAISTGADQRKHQSSASLAFVRGIHRGPVNSPHKWPVMRKTFSFDDVIMGLPR